MDGNGACCSEIPLDLRQCHETRCVDGVLGHGCGLLPTGRKGTVEAGAFAVTVSGGCRTRPCDAVAPEERREPAGGPRAVVQPVAAALGQVRWRTQAAPAAVAPIIPASAAGTMNRSWKYPTA